MKVLIIDDDPRLVKAWGITIRDWPLMEAKAVRCTSLSMAIAEIEEYEPNVLLVDHELTTGGCEGLELAATYRNEMTVISIGNPVSAEYYSDLGIKQISKGEVIMALQELFNL